MSAPVSQLQQREPRQTQTGPPQIRTHPPHSRRCQDRQGSQSGAATPLPSGSPRKTSQVQEGVLDLSPASPSQLPAPFLGAIADNLVPGCGSRSPNQARTPVVGAAAQKRGETGSEWRGQDVWPRRLSDPSGVGSPAPGQAPPQPSWRVSRRAVRVPQAAGASCAAH